MTIEWLIICVSVGVIVYQLLWTWLHGRNLRKHAEEVRRIYAEDFAKRWMK